MGRPATPAARLNSVGLGRRAAPAASSSPRAAVLGPAGLDWHRRNEREHEEFRNWIAAHSLDRIVAYDPVAFAEDIAATPLLMILADADTTSPPGVAGQVYDGAGEPKQLVELSAGHYDVYDNPAARQVCIEATIKFPARHLSATWAFLRQRCAGLVAGRTLVSVTCQLS